MSIILPAVLSIGCFVVLVCTGRVTVQAVKYLASERPADHKRRMIIMLVLAVAAVISLTWQFVEIINTMNGTGGDLL